MAASTARPSAEEVGGGFRWAAVVDRCAGYSTARGHLTQCRIGVPLMLLLLVLLSAADPGPTRRGEQKNIADRPGQGPGLTSSELSCGERMGSRRV